MKKFRSEETDILFEAIMSLKDIEECKNFFEDLCTYKEITDMAQRLTVADMLMKNEKYLDISGKTGASSATISRVARCISSDDSGYVKVLKRNCN